MLRDCTKTVERQFHFSSFDSLIDWSVSNSTYAFEKNKINKDTVRNSASIFDRFLNIAKCLVVLRIICVDAVTLKIDWDRYNSSGNQIPQRERCKIALIFEI